MDVASVRRYYAELVVPVGVEGRDRIVAAFAAVPREQYVGPGPWRVLVGDGHYIATPSDNIGFLYQDRLVALAEERGINNGLPSAHAIWLAALAPKLGDTVVHIGAGTGYYTALLAELVGDSGTVVGYEIAVDLAQRAAANLRSLGNVRIVARSALEGPVPSCDVLYVNAAVTDLADAWLDALRPGGRLLAPLTPKDGLGGMLLVTRHSASLPSAARFVSGARFISCVGGIDESSSGRLAAAFQTNTQGEVRSFHRSAQTDATCWYAAPRWWLSTRPIE